MEQLINCKKLGQDIVNVKIIPWTFPENLILNVVVVLFEVTHSSGESHLHMREDDDELPDYRHFLLYN